MEGYILVADLLGFSNIIENSSDEKLLLRISDWVQLINDVAAKSEITKHQLISDTVFAAVESNPESFGALVNFARQLLQEGIKRSFPIRGAISHGLFEWGKLIYGKAVIKAHKLEMSQNWIGITCDHQLPHLDGLWGINSVICYPPPMKSGLISVHPVISWDVPEFTSLVRYLTKGGLIKDGELIGWEWAEKVNNTVQFGMYRCFLQRQGISGHHFHGILPIQVLSQEGLTRESSEDA